METGNLGLSVGSLRSSGLWKRIYFWLIVLLCDHFSCADEEKFEAVILELITADCGISQLTILYFSHDGRLICSACNVENFEGILLAATAVKGRTWQHEVVYFVQSATLRVVRRKKSGNFCSCCQLITIFH